MGALGDRIVPVIDPVRAVAGIVVHGDAAGGVNPLAWGVQGAQMVIDGDAVRSRPGAGAAGMVPWATIARSPSTRGPSLRTTVMRSAWLRIAVSVRPR